MNDYAHCRVCDKVINLDVDTWYTDGNDTFCADELSAYDTGKDYKVTVKEQA